MAEVAREPAREAATKYSNLPEPESRPVEHEMVEEVVVGTPEGTIAGVPAGAQDQVEAILGTSTVITESHAAGGLNSSPVREERVEEANKTPESPSVMVPSVAPASSPTTGLVSTSVLASPLVLPPSPQPSTHEEEQHLDYSGSDEGFDYGTSPSVQDPSKLANFTLADFDALFAEGGKS